MKQAFASVKIVNDFNVFRRIHRIVALKAGFTKTAAILLKLIVLSKP